MTDSEIKHQIINEDTVRISTGNVLDNDNVHHMVDLITTLQEKKYKYLLVNMEALEFISSSGVGSILGTVETSREMGGDIILYNLVDSVMNVFQVLDLTDYLTIRNKYEEVKELCNL